MGRWTQFDEDEYRLPEGMRRIGYDSDTGRYLFGGRDGSTWAGAQGAAYSEMTRISSGTRHPNDVDDNSDIETAPTRSDGYYAIPTNPDNEPSLYQRSAQAVMTRSTAYQTLLPFFLIIGVFLLLVWRFILSPTPSSSCPIHTTAYRVKAGDSCWEIAQAHECTLDKLEHMNPNANCGLLIPGTTLCLPGDPAPA